jgi:hypothetical protein
MWILVKENAVIVIQLNQQVNGDETVKFLTDIYATSAE